LITTKKRSYINHQYHVDILTLLRKHDRLFGEIPPGIPPYRGFDHTIELEEGGNPVITTPYRHPKKFKDKIEKEIKELFEMGHIKPSSSPFASLVVLVKKNDGTMRTCIDYQALNNKTIENDGTMRMCILDELVKKNDGTMRMCILDELVKKNDGTMRTCILDELHGAVYFSKIDRQSSYHQIKVREQHVHKNTLRCHYGHYEFLVMPFGLTNTPTNFQTCMNHIFNKQLRKFMLVLFDDLLIYNKKWEDHLMHLDEILGIIGQQTLYAKASKCEFGMIDILYLKHVISAQGV
jgi:hypothetical protein